MRFVRSRIAFVIGALALLAAASPQLPSPLVGGSQWEVSKSASGANSTRLCLPDSALLMQWEHRNQPCTRVVIAAGPESANVHYTCPGGDFGTSKLTVVTPRTVKIESQGISRGLPFAHTIHARRIGECPSR